MALPKQTRANDWSLNVPRLRRLAKKRIERIRKAVEEIDSAWGMRGEDLVFESAFGDFEIAVAKLENDLTEIADYYDEETD